MHTHANIDTHTHRHTMNTAKTGVSQYRWLQQSLSPMRVFFCTSSAPYLLPQLSPLAPVVRFDKFTPTLPPTSDDHCQHCSLCLDYVLSYILGYSSNPLWDPSCLSHCTKKSPLTYRGSPGIHPRHKWVMKERKNEGALKKSPHCIVLRSVKWTWSSTASAQVYMLCFGFFKTFPLGGCKEADLQPKCLPLVIFHLITLSLPQGLLC